MKIKLLLLIALISNIYIAKASHLLGGDITFSCNTNGSYNVYLTLYRDCNGIEPANTQEIHYKSVACNVNAYINLYLENKEEIKITCDDIETSCDNGNGNYGVEKYIYRGTLNIPPCGDDWVLGWSQCCRNDAISTLNAPYNQEMYVQAHLNNTVCNNSPTFNNHIGYLVCANQEVVYNHAVSEIDGDSLYFSLGNCYQAENVSVNYTNPYSYVTPLSTDSGITINPNTGAITFTPNMQQVGVFCINVKEYRNGVLISEVNRDMQFTVVACTNQTPTASGINNTVNYSISSCANSELCFNIYANDLDQEELFMSWNEEIPDATFTVTGNGTENPVGNFCWTPTSSDVGFHTFTVNVRDDNCPAISMATYTYTIEVTGSSNIFTVSPNDTICYGDSLVLTTNSNPTATSISWTPIYSLSDSVGTSVTAFPLSSTNYEVTASFSDGCKMKKNIDIYVAQHPNIIISPNNSFLCSGQSIDLNATPSTQYSYNWSGGITIDSSGITVSPTTTTTYTVEVTDTVTQCSNSATATVNIASTNSTVCNVLYVAPNGTSTADGTKISPLDLETALELGACRGTTIKMAIGDYITDSTINKVTSYITLEGGFDNTTPDWDKISQYGATKILRTATRSTSLASTSTVTQGSGIQNEFSSNPEIVAIEVTGQSGFRFQDLTISSNLTNPIASFQGEEGIDVIGVRLNNCDEYNIVRTRITSGYGSQGAGQEYTINATNGGDSKALIINNNGAGASILSSNILASNGGAGGQGNANGSPTPHQSGSNGASQNIDFTGGTPLVNNVNNFDLLNQPLIKMDDIACANTDIGFVQANSGSWTFGTASNPTSANGDSVYTQYSTTGRKDINYNNNTYEGFANTLVDNQGLPTFLTTAPLVLGKHRICAGTKVSFVATNGSPGYVYHWDLGGAATPNNYDGGNYETLDSIPFNTPGVYTIQLEYESNCCGTSMPATVEIYVEEVPNATIPSDISLCRIEDTLNLSVTGALNNGNVYWSPTLGLEFIDSVNVKAHPDTSTTYTVSLTDSTGLCSQTDSFEVKVTYFDIMAGILNVDCDTNNTGVIALNVAGGSGMYSYNWTTLGNIDTNFVTNLTHTFYPVEITDLYSGCILDTSFIVAKIVPYFDVFMVHTEMLSCSGLPDGSITARVYGGNPPFHFYWYDSNNNLISSTTYSYNDEDTLEMIGAGTYTVRVIDQDSCTTAVISGFIPENDAVQLEILDVTNPTCLNANNGSITINANGANLPISIQWDDPAQQTTSTASNLSPGTYCVTVVDSSGCTDERCFTLSGNPYSSITVQENICYESSFNYPGGGSGIILNDTTLVDTLTSSFGCDSIVTTHVFVLSLPQLSASANPDTINLGQSSTLAATGTGNFVWDNTYNGANYTVSPNTQNNTYYVSLEDANGCISTDSVFVYVIGGSQNLVLIPNAFSPNNDGVNDIFQVVNDENYANIELTVYNRWGEIVHHESGATNYGWDGTYQGVEQPVDVYYFIVTTTSFTGEVNSYSGVISLFR